MDKWTRALKNVCTFNLAAAILVVLAYSVYSISMGMPVDQRFLGKNPDWFGGLSSPEISPLFLILVLEAIVVVMFFGLRYVESD